MGIVRNWLVALVVGALAGPAVAGAATVSSSGGVVTFTDGGAEANTVTVATVPAGGFFVDLQFVDTGVGAITAGPGCTQTAANDVRCVYFLLSRLDANLGDGRNEWNSAAVALPTVVNGGSQEDKILTGAGADVLNGGAGYELLSDGPGNDVVDGGPGGSATAAVGSGADLISNCSVADYTARTNPVALSLDGIANDGEVGEGDNLVNVRALWGGAGNDTLVGDDVEYNTIEGRAGDDTILGLGGPDYLDGGDGNDVLRGGAGDDRLYGHAGSNQLFGEAGNDELEFPFPGSASLISGGGGRDLTNGINPIVVRLDGVANDGQVSGALNSNILADIEHLRGSGGRDTMVGGPGPNLIDAFSGDDIVDGGGGDDELLAGDGDDIVLGGPGDDTIDGGEGADRMRGGTGEDTVTYESRLLPVRVTIGVPTPDGEIDEGDAVAIDVENVTGGRGADRLIGSVAANLLIGGPGGDVIDGGRGNDELFGGPGADRITGGSGIDSVLGGSGADRIFVRDRTSDDVRCGGGVDRVSTADRTGRRRDITAVDCEIGRVR